MATSIDALDIQITASANNANVAIDNLVRRLGTLNTSLSRVNGRSFNNLGNSVRNISNGFHNLSSVFSRTNSSIKKTTDLTTSLAQAFGKFYASYFLVIRGTKKLWSAIESTADYIEAYNYFDVAMGKVGADWEHQWEKYSERAGVSSAEEYADSFANRLNTELRKLSGVNLEIDAQGNGLLTTNSMKNLGLNIQEVTQYASQLASVTNSVGQTGETTLAIADSFTKLAGDISSLFNVSYSTVATNLQSGLIGQSRALYKYGIDITNATLQTKAYELGLEKAVSEMTQMEKMQLRVLAILEQSKVSWGDLANTLQSPSNQIRLLKNNFAELAMVIGQLFMPILSKVLPIINGVVIALKRLAVMIANFFGIKLNLSEYGQGYSDLEEDIGGVSDGFDEATKSVKKFKGQLQKFDELNNLSTGSNSKKGEGIGSTIDLTDEILKATDEYNKAWQKAFDEMENKAEAIADAIAAIAKRIFNPIKKAWDIAGGYVVNAWKKALNEMFKLASAIGSDMLEVWEQAATVEMLKNIFYILGDIGYTIGYIEERFRVAWESGDTGLRILENIRDIFAVIIDNIQRASSATVLWANTLDFEPILSAIEAWTASLVPVFDSLSGIVTDFYEQVLLPLGKWALEKGLPDLIQVLIDFNEKIDWEALRTRLSEFWSHVEPFAETIGEGLIIFVERITDAIANFVGSESFENFLTSVENWMDNVSAEDVADAFEKIATVLIVLKVAVVAYSALALPIKILSSLFGIFKGFVGVGKGLVSGIASIGKFLGNAGTAIIGFAKNIGAIGTSIGEMLANGVGLKTALTSIFGGVATTIAGIGSVVVGAITAILSFFDMLKNGFSWVKEIIMIVGAAVAAVGAIILGAPALIAGVVAAVGVAIATLVVVIKDNWQAIKDWFANLFKAIGGFVKGIIDKLAEVGKGIGNWFANSVKPWFTIEKWKGIFENIKTSLTNVWNNTVVAWATGVSNWWTNSVKPWFTIEKWKGILTNVKTAFVNIFNDIKNKITEIISGLWTDISDFFANIGKGVNDAKSNLGEGLGQLPGLGNIANAVTGKSIPAYATGGFPEDGLFFANRNELVGSFSNGKTAVANNEQITEGIKWAAYEGMKMALSEQQGGNVNVNVSLEGDANRLFKVVKEENYNQFKRTGRNALAF